MSNKGPPDTQDIPEGLKASSQQRGMKTSQILYYITVARSESNRRMLTASSQTPSLNALEYYTAVKMKKLASHIDWCLYYSFENQVHSQCFLVNSNTNITPLLCNHLPSVAGPTRWGARKLCRGCTLSLGPTPTPCAPSLLRAPSPLSVHGSCILLPPLALPKPSRCIAECGE